MSASQERHHEQDDPATRPDVARNGDVGRADPRRRADAVREAEGTPARGAGDRRRIPCGAPDGAVQLRARPRRRRAEVPRDDGLRSPLSRPVHRDAGRRELRRFPARGHRPARADAGPRAPAVPRLGHRRRAGRALRDLQQGASRDHRRRLRHAAHLRQPERLEARPGAAAGVRRGTRTATAARAQGAGRPADRPRCRSDPPVARGQGRLARCVAQGLRGADRWRPGRQPAVHRAPRSDERAAAGSTLLRHAVAAARGNARGREAARRDAE